MSDLSNKIDQVRDILRTDDGISGAMDYTQAISWVLFLKFLDDYENSLDLLSIRSDTSEDEWFLCSSGSCFSLI